MTAVGLGAGAVHAGVVGADIHQPPVALIYTEGNTASEATFMPKCFMAAIARVSGHPLLPRYGRTHTLNHKRVARTVAQELQPFANVLDQADYRAGVIARCLEQAGLSGQVDAIVLTGGVIYSQAFRQLLLSRISYLGRVICKPGEEEMDSLAYYLNAVLTGELQPKEYN